MTPSERVSALVRQAHSDGMSYKSLAQKLNMSQTAFSAKVNNRRAWRLDEVLELSKILDTPIEQMCSDSC